MNKLIEVAGGRLVRTHTDIVKAFRRATVNLAKEEAIEAYRRATVNPFEEEAIEKSTIKLSEDCGYLRVKNQFRRNFAGRQKDLFFLSTRSTQDKVTRISG